MVIDDATLLARRQQALGRNAPLFYDRPLHAVKGQGVWLEDAQGRRYLDVYNNVPTVGHCHPHVVEAIARQAATLNIHSRYLHENAVLYAERLTATLGPDLSAVMFTCTGTEANELALRLARFQTGGEGIIVSNFAYHGNSRLVASLTSAFAVPEPFPDFARAVPIPCPYRDGAQNPEALAETYAAHIAQAVESLQAAGHRMGALLICPIFANEGLPTPVPTYLAKAFEIVRAAGGVVIADEVQAGFGRTGTMWGHQSQGVTPDIITMGKPMANGHPVGGVVARRDLVDTFAKAATYFNTFAANPVSAAAGMAVLDVIESEGLLANAPAVGAYVHAGLQALAAKHDILGDVRATGLFFAAELVSDRARKTPAPAETKRIINIMRDNGVLISRIGIADNVLKMRPPLIFSRENADQLLATLDHALNSL